MDNVWFVNYRIHNKENNTWVFKNDTKHDTYESALKAYHSALSTYIDYGNLDFVYAEVQDRYGNVTKDFWEKPEEPEPTPEPEPEPEET